MRSRHQKILATTTAGLLAVIATGVTAVVTSSFAFPFYAGIFYIGPFAFLWFLLPGLIAPVLITKAPVSRQGMVRVALITAIAFGGSLVYLKLMPSYEFNSDRESAIANLWLALLPLAALASVGWLRAMPVVTWTYHIILVTWFFALGFPYLGEFL